MNKIQNSLSKKIVAMVAVSFLLINIILHGGIAFLNKKTFYKLEGEKGDIIVKNYAHMFAINMYLGMNDKINDLADQILKNESVLKVELFHNKKPVLKKTKSTDTDGIVISKDILRPNSDEKLGKLQILYSTKHFEAFMKHYALILTYAMIAVMIALLFLNIYIQKLLYPLKKLAATLIDYSPEKQINIPFLDEKNEIGLISNALERSYKKALEYETNLQQLNKTLEERVQKTTKELRQQLFTDTITKLPNRLALLHTLEKSQNGILAILHLDNFKEINSFYGYEIGDKLLKLVRDKIKIIFQNSDYQFYKLPGREFVLYSQRVESKVIFHAILLEFTNILNKNPFIIDDYEIDVTFTIGASIDEIPLLAKADIALQEAHQLKLPIVIYNNTHHIEKQIDKNIKMIKKIKSAINDDRIAVYFQPIFDNRTGNIKSYESLVRIVEKDGKVLSPYFFLDIAKKAKLYKQIAKIVIEKSCKTFKNTPHNFSLNFEIDDLLDRELVNFTLKTAQKYGVIKQLTFEILESESIEDIDAVTAFTNQISKHGCKISIDDFGSGYSNFMHVLKLEADYLKIDGSLIKNIHQDNDAKIIVNSIVNFAKELGLKTVAEFIHCQEVQDEILRLGIDYSQGFLLGEPKPELIKEKEPVFI